MRLKDERKYREQYWLCLALSNYKKLKRAGPDYKSPREKNKQIKRRKIECRHHCKLLSQY